MDFYKRPLIIEYSVCAKFYTIDEWFFYKYAPVLVIFRVTVSLWNSDNREISIISLWF